MSNVQKIACIPVIYALLSVMSFRSYLHILLKSPVGRPMALYMGGTLRGFRLQTLCLPHMSVIMIDHETEGIAQPKG